MNEGWLGWLLKPDVRGKGFCLFPLGSGMLLATCLIVIVLLGKCG